MDAEASEESMVRKEIRKRIEKAKRASMDGLLDRTDEKKQGQRRRASLILQNHATYQENALPAFTTRCEKLASLMEIGKEMLNEGVITLPTLSWDSESADPNERAAVDQFGFLFQSYRSAVLLPRLAPGRIRV